MQLDDLRLGTNQKNAISYLSHMKKLVIIQTNLRVLESMGTDDVIQGFNHDEIDITKAPSLPWLEIEDQYYVL